MILRPLICRVFGHRPGDVFTKLTGSAHMPLGFAMWLQQRCTRCETLLKNEPAPETIREMKLRGLTRSDL